MSVAIVVRAFGPPAVMKLESSVALPALTATQVLVCIHAAGVNPVDTYIRGAAAVRACERGHACWSVLVFVRLSRE